MYCCKNFSINGKILDLFYINKQILKKMCAKNKKQGNVEKSNNFGNALQIKRTF